MINQMNQNENTPNKFFCVIKELKIGKLLYQSNISKNCGVPAFEVFQFLSLLAAKVTAALPSLMALFVNITKTFSVQITEMIKN
ncbi:MAG: hypothetical protein HFJ09_06235 [Lachnospiraceae bacterium]|nr:hypothetical protein [Lachnospiraceae bacterium]